MNVAEIIKKYLDVESTDKIVTLNGIPARIWEGETDSGIKCHCFITRIAARENENLEQFERELKSQRAPSSDVQAIPARLVL